MNRIKITAYGCIHLAIPEHNRIRQARPRYSMSKEWMRLPALIQLGSTARGGEDSRPSNQSRDVRVVTFTNGKMHVLVGSVEYR